jgi:type IV pilus assembly protein PilM
MIGANKSRTVVGLDIEAGSIAAAEVRSNGGVEVGRTAVVPIEPGLSREGEVGDVDRLGEALKQMCSEIGFPREVRAGIANQRVVVRTLRLPLIEDEEEIEAAVRFQAADQVPMPLDQAVLDWQVLEPTTEALAAQQMDVAVVAARRDSVAGLARACRLAGLRLTGIDSSAFGMIRAIATDLPAAEAPTVSYEERMAGDVTPEQVAPPSRLLCHLGEFTNLAVVSGRRCLFTRVAPFGIEGIAMSLAERRALTLEQARMWLPHVGLVQPLEEIDGPPEIVEAARSALVEGAGKLADAMRLSLDYFGSQEGATAIEEIVICGQGSAIEGLAAELERMLGYAVRTVRPEPLSSIEEPYASRLTLAYGLALEE